MFEGIDVSNVKQTFVYKFTKTAGHASFDLKNISFTYACFIHTNTYFSMQETLKFEIKNGLIHIYHIFVIATFC